MRKMTKDQCRDAGMAVVLLLLILYLRLKWEGLLLGAILVQVLNMIWPPLFEPIAIVWSWLAHLMGTVVSKVFLSIVYITLVTPVGILRRLAGKDSLRLRAFKASRSSVMLERNHTFTADDLERPY